VRVLGKLAEIRDSGIPIYFFVGNHDLWMEDYFQKELNIPVYHDNQKYTLVIKPSYWMVMERTW
jgi:UDP-2,3-diacylglucosamine hydrolase